MKKTVAVLLVLALLQVTGRLPPGREIEGLQLITALAVDGDREVAATALTAVRVGEGEQPQLFTGAGEDLAVACRALRESSSRRAYLGQTAQLLVGEDCDLWETLTFVLDHRELRLDTLLYMVDGQAGAGLMASAGKVSAENGGTDPRAVTVGQALARLSAGDYQALPALAPGREGLTPDGWAVAGPQGVVGRLRGQAALGCELLSGVEMERVIPLPGGAVEVLRAHWKVRGGTLYCALTARPAQGSPRAGQLEEWGEAVLTAALAPGWDCWGLLPSGGDVSGLAIAVKGRWAE